MCISVASSWPELGIERVMRSQYALAARSGSSAWPHIAATSDLSVLVRTLVCFRDDQFVPRRMSESKIRWDRS